MGFSIVNITFDKPPFALLNAKKLELEGHCTVKPIQGVQRKFALFEANQLKSVSNDQDC